MNEVNNIPEGWVETTLGEVVEIGSSKRIFFSEYVSKGIPFYRSKEIIEKQKGNNISSELFITEKKFNEIDKQFGSPKKDDLLLTSVGTLGVPYLVKENEKFYFKDGNLTWFKQYKNLNPDFLYNWILSSIGKERINSITIGSTQSALTISGLRTLSINLPPLPEQKSIAAIFTAFDDKIELLQAQNKTLEELAQTIFKEWFGKYKVGDKLPEGWRVGVIEDLTLKMNSGGTPSTKEESYYNGYINWFSTKELQDNFIFESDKKITEEGLNNSSTKLFPKDTVIMAIYAAPTVGRLGILNQESAFNQAAVGLIAKNKVGYPFVFLLLKYFRDEFNNLSNGAAQQNLNVGIVKNFKICIPNEESLNFFNKIQMPLFEKIRANSIQIQTLTKTRDELLPKLMTGEIRVKMSEL